MFSWLTRTMFKLWGWKVEGEIPNHLPKKLYVVVPHTSNWDFPVGILLKYGYNMGVGFIGKSSLFKFPFGWIFKIMGGIPVDRSKTKGFKEAVVETIRNQERFCTAIAAEGKRGKVDKLKTGFYHIAVGAGIPIVYVKFDWKNKVAAFDKPKQPESNVKLELEYAKNYYKDTVGYFPEKSFGYPFENEIGTKI